MSSWRLVESGYNDPYTNMAVDEAILQSYSAGIVPPTLRVYGWNPPAISLGYFQNAEQILNIDKCEKMGVNFVRRITGGEAIFHQNELTYSIFCSKKDLDMPQSVKEDFKKITGFLIAMYKSLGLDAGFFLDTGASLSSSFCFAKNNTFDISIGGRKIGGNAQKRTKNVIFQHGSILLEFKLEKIRPFFREDLQKAANRIISLNEALGRDLDFKEGCDLLVESFKDTFSIDLIKSGLSEKEQEDSCLLRERKYRTLEWNVNRKIR